MIISLFIIVSCNKDDYELRLSDFNFPVVTGFYLRSDFGDLVGIIGTPNVNNGDFNSEYALRFSPNPASEYCYIHTKSPASMTLKKIWITHAQFNVQIPNYSFDIGATNLKAGGMPLIQAEFIEDSYPIDLSLLDEGYYRIYLKIDDLLLYDNLIIVNPNK